MNREHVTHTLARTEALVYLHYAPCLGAGRGVSVLLGLQTA